MAPGLLAEAVRRGLERAGLDSSFEVGLITYLELLERWNRKINLTAFDLGLPSDQAVDRLVIEPLQAARVVAGGDRRLVDVGSGGGSPAIPLLLACPWVRLTMVEVRERKAAFLREAIRVLDLAADVQVVRFEEWAEAISGGSIDVVSMRAVRPDDRVLSEIARVLGVGGRFVWFGKIGDITELTRYSWSTSQVSLGVHVLWREVAGAP